MDADPEVGESRVEAVLPSGAIVILVTRQYPHPAEIERQVAAASAGISALAASSSFVGTHAAARREIDRATQTGWARSTILIDEEHHPVSVLRLLAGSWAGYAVYRGMGIAIGTSNIDVREVKLATLNGFDLGDRR